MYYAEKPEDLELIDYLNKKIKRSSNIGRIEQRKRGMPYMDTKDFEVEFDNSRNLVGVCIRGNINTIKFEELVDLLTSFSHLDKLVFSGNHVKSIPEKLLDLTQLRYLTLSANWIRVLPDRIGRLSKLCSLDLSDNMIASLPDEVGKMAEMTKLDLSNNHLTSVPQVIRKLTQLKKLDLSMNGIMEMPAWLSELGDIRDLAVRGNQLTEIPKAIRMMSDLYDLDLRDNQIEEINPSLISVLEEKGRIYYSGNPIDELMKAKLEGLSRLASSHKYASVDDERRYDGRYKQVDR